MHIYPRLNESGKWARKYDRCQNCETVRFRHKARGYCERCYPLIRRLERIQGWDLSRPETLKEYPRETIFRNPDTFKMIKTRFGAEIQRRLDILKIRENKLAGPIYGIDLEYALRSIAGHCRVRDKHLFHGSASWLGETFDMDQRKELYRLLIAIEENIPWPSIWTSLTRFRELQ